VGDLINKGPKSVETVQFARTSGMFSVRGNHDERALEVLEMKLEDRPEKYKYLERLTRCTLLAIIFDSSV
jgi:hypothetical protein